MAQRLTDSRTEILISSVAAIDFNKIRILDFTNDFGEDYVLEKLDVETYAEELMGAGYDSDSRAVTMCSDIYEINPGAEIYFYGEEIIAVEPENSISEIVASIISQTNIVIAYDLITAFTDIEIEEHYDLIKTVRTTIPHYKYKGIITPTLAKALRDEISGISDLITTGDVDKNEDAKITGYLSSYFPHSVDGFSINLPGILENDFTQAEEDEILGEQKGAIDSNGNGGINTIFIVQETGRPVFSWGMTTQGEFLTIELFKKWLDYNGEQIISNFLIDSKRVTADDEGASQLESIFYEKILKVAVSEGVLYADSSGNPLNLLVKDLFTGEKIKTSVTTEFTGDHATLTYILALKMGIKTVSIRNTLFAGGGIDG